ncbi:MAG: glycosyltransferase [Saprospiraceae bacterium]|nr:glycosyltransferase [Saprospiraceae bacterium]
MNLWTVLLALFVLATGVQLAAWWGLFVRLARWKDRPLGLPSPMPVSVLICARNEARNLALHLPAILEQVYPEFEVLVLDDDSSDETPAVLQRLQARYAHLRVLRLSPKTTAGKKAILARGIAEARFGQLVFTDADCRPAGPDWLRHLAAGLANADIVLGYGPCAPAPGWLNRWSRFETVHTAMLYFSAALAGQPYMGVGRNLAWRREVFVRSGGFASHAGLASGDDDLLVNAAANNQNTAVCLAPGSFMYSAGKTSWREWWQQKQRHLSAGKLYRLRHQIALSLLAGTQIGHYFLLTALLFSDFGMVSVIFYALRMASALVLNWRILRHFRDERLFIWFPLFDAFLAIYYAVFVPRALIKSIHLISWK